MTSESAAMQRVREQLAARKRRHEERRRRTGWRSPDGEPQSALGSANDVADLQEALAELADRVNSELASRPESDPKLAERTQEEIQAFLEGIELLRRKVLEERERRRNTTLKISPSGDPVPADDAFGDTSE